MIEIPQRTIYSCNIVRAHIFTNLIYWIVIDDEFIRISYRTFS